MAYNLKSIREKFKENGIFYTPRPLAEYMKSFLPENITDVYDPTCGHGSLLEVFPDSVKKYGQDINPEAVEAAKSILNSEIVCKDTLQSPAFINKKFRAIIANPPFSVKWTPDELKDDARFTPAPCMPPPSKADFAFLMHIVHYLSEDGTAAILNSPGIGYRGQREGKIRKWLIEQNFVDAVIHIPGNQFIDTPIPLLGLILKKNRENTDIRFIDRENEAERLVSFDEVRENDFSLCVSTYIQPKQEREEVDPKKLEFDIRENFCKSLRGSLEISYMLQVTMGGESIAPLLAKLQEIIDEYKERLKDLDRLSPVELC
jgi:type I restriction-modification system, M subunit